MKRSLEHLYPGVLVKIPKAVGERYASKQSTHDFESGERYLPSPEAVELFEALLDIHRTEKVYLDTILNAYENADDAVLHLTELGAAQLVYFWDEWTDFYWDDEGWKQAVFDLMGDEGGDPHIWD
jgi:hypothetical protein